ncbi:MAG: GNAT family N-acetyltransferase [Pseudomonadota bacterium]
MSPPNLQPTLTGPRILIRPVRADDWEAMYAAASDPEIWAVHPARDRYLAPVFRKFFDGALASGGGFAFVDRASGAIVGSSRYHNYRPELSEIEIGYTFLTRPYWGGSHNAEVKLLMIEHAFTFVETTLFWVGETNWRSQGAMKKIGGVQRDGVFMRALDGQEKPHVVFEIRKESFDRERLVRARDG